MNPQKQFSTRTDQLYEKALMVLYRPTDKVLRELEIQMVYIIYAEQGTLAKEIVILTEDDSIYLNLEKLIGLQVKLHTVHKALYVDLPERAYEIYQEYKTYIEEIETEKQYVSSGLRNLFNVCTSYEEINYIFPDNVLHLLYDNILHARMQKRKETVAEDRKPYLDSVKKENQHLLYLINERQLDNLLMK